jgi:arsenite methyltransferase
MASGSRGVVPRPLQTCVMGTRAMSGSEERHSRRYDGVAASLRLEATYATADLVAQRRAVLDALALRSGERVLDLGSGPGFLAVEMAELVGPTGCVVGVDVSDTMRAMARARADRGPTARWVEFHPGDATRLPFPEDAFEVAVATQVLEYVADVPGALAELFRVLRPGGRLLVLDTDWDSLVWHSSDPARMTRVLVAWDEHLAHPHLPRILSPLLRAAEFRVERRSIFSLFNPDLSEDTYSHWVIDSIAAFVTGRQGVSREEAYAWAADLRALGTAGGYFLSLNRYLFLCAKG